MSEAEATKKRTITLTDRPPVTIAEEHWPVIARASDKRWDNEFEFQANRVEKAWLVVRQHEDGRTLVYGGRHYDSAWVNEPDRHSKGGELLPTGSDIVAAIRRVAAVIDEQQGESYFGRVTCEDIAAECIADLPAEEI